MNTICLRISAYILKSFLKIIFPFLIILILPLNLEAQDINSRPRLGLVLSGGGAHGIAHVGVLKVMEEAGLRPDNITGVSMGSIIGGLYSLGYSADSLHKILNSINWKLILSNKIPENKVIYLEKDHFSNSVISLPLSFRKVVLPSGLINGQQAENMLSFYAWPAADISNFLKLPIPFLCVGTDIITYRKVDLKSGYLPDAIRASFSVPTIFTPLKIDTMLMLDGGLIRNFAATEAKEMGSDIIIGSYVGFKGYKAAKLQSVSGIMEQIAMFRSLDDFEKEKKLVDFLIKPKTEGFSIFDFENVDSLIARGYRAALPFRERFRKLADSLDRIGLQKPVPYILGKELYSFSKIEISGNKSYSDNQILGVLDIRPGEKVDKYLISDKIDLLYGKAWFDKVKYRIIPGNDSLILAIDCIEKPQTMLYGSVHYDNYLQSGLILELTAKNIITPRSVIDVASRLGQYYKAEISFLQFIDKNQKFGLSANLNAENTPIPLFEIKGDIGEVISRNFTPGMTLNKRLGLNNMMSLSAKYENKRLLLDYISDIYLKSLSFNFITTSFDYNLNTLDNKHFPHKGTILNVSVRLSRLLSEGIRTDSSNTILRWSNPSSVSSSGFYTFRGSVNHYFTPGGKLTISFGGEALLISSSDSISSQNNFYLLGGIEPISNRSIPMAGFQANEIPVKTAAGIRTSLDLEVFENIHLNLMANIFAAREINRETGFSLPGGIALGAGYMSIIGPIRIGIMYGSYKRELYLNKIKGYFSLGYNF